MKVIGTARFKLTNNNPEDDDDELSPETIAMMAKMETMMRDALRIGDEKLGVDYLIKAGFGSALTCGMMLGRVMGH